MRSRPDLPADPVIDAYKGDIDGALLREWLKPSPVERVDDSVALARFAEELARTGRASRKSR